MSKTLFTVAEKIGPYNKEKHLEWLSDSDANRVKRMSRLVGYRSSRNTGKKGRPVGVYTITGRRYLMSSHY